MYTYITIGSKVIEIDTSVVSSLEAVKAFLEAFLAECHKKPVEIDDSK
jgi:hypothetical protein